MAALVTLAQAKAHLRIDTIDGDPDDVDLQLKIDQASAIVIDYLSTRADPNWSVADPLPTGGIVVPGNVSAAVLLVLAHLYEHRGDDMATVDEALWLAVTRLLVRFKDAALA